MMEPLLGGTGPGRGLSSSGHALSTSANMGCSSAVPVNTMMSMASHPVPIAANRDDRQAQRKECDLSGSPVSLVEVDRSTTNAAEAGTSASAVTDKPRTFDELVAFIRATMGKCGLGDSDVDVERLQAAMSFYQSKSEEWQSYAFYDRFRYTRNLVDDGNGKYNLLLLCWGPGHVSPIHDHANAHCLLKVMDGELTETLYDWPEHGDSLKAVTTTTAANGTSTTAHGLHVSSVRNLGMDAVAYMHDKIGLHRVANTNTSRPAVSLHLYSPPIDVCQTFCESTGEARKSGKCVFFSVGGRRTATCNAGLGEMCKE